MTEAQRTHLRPVYQIGICLVLIVVVRLYYAWVESQTYWLYPRFADRPSLLAAVYLGLVPVVSLVAAVVAYRYFSPALTIPFAAVGGGTAGLIVNSIPGAMIGAVIGLVLYSRTLRRWMRSGVQIFLRFDLPALLWGLCIGSLATSLLVKSSGQASLIQLTLLIVFFTGLTTLLVIAVRTYRERPGSLFQAIAGCLVASGLGLAIGPMANTLYRVYALNQVGDVAWNPMPRFNGVGGNLWEIYSVVLNGETTDSQLRLLQGLPSITSVYVRDADVSDEAVADVLGNLPNLELLRFQNVAISDKALVPLQGSTRLFDLTVTGANITDQTLANLAPIPVLQLLQVDGIQMQGDGLKKLAAGGRLRHLVINNATLTDDDLADLKGLRGLRTLHLVDTRIIGGGLVHLSKLPWLDNLRLADSPLDDHYLADLNPNKLKFLYLDGISLSNEGATAIAGMTSLVGLSLRRTNLDDAQLRILSKLPTTTQLYLDGRRLSPDATDRLMSEDIYIQIDNGKVTVDDIERLIAIGHEVHLNDCELDEASIERLATHNTEPRFVIRVPMSDGQMTELPSGGSVQVIRYVPGRRVM